MPFERWWWLCVCLVLSVCIHVGVALKSRTFHVAVPRAAAPAEIEVALEPLPEPEPEKKPEEPEPKPKVKPQPEPQQPLEHQPERTVGAPRKRAEREAAEIVKPREKTGPQRLVKTVDPRPTAPNAEPGGLDPTRNERPLPLGLPSARRDTDAPRLIRVAKADPNPGGGGAPAPGPVPGGRGGARGPEAPPEDIIYNGGGAGGVNLPKAAPRIGGGGGRSILSVSNPLAKEVVPDERPGLGPGLGGGAGAGAGGGAGYGRGKGIGTSLDGQHALATLRRKPGPGIGGGEGRGIGTRPPGGGRGAGAELPGTGGTGLGYGRGSGVGFGSGKGVGIGDGAGGGTGRNTLARGIPFGDLSGLLTDGDPNGGGGKGGGPGGPGRGAVFGVKAPPSGGGSARFVYVLDTSTSMRQGDKMPQAKLALKKALLELKTVDTFNIVCFDGGVRSFAAAMQPASPENVRRAVEYVDAIDMRPGTNISDALETALRLEKITHVFLLSDGEPSRGITNPDQLRAMVRERNTQKAQILTLALGLGEQFPGIPLLKGLAEDNDGKFSYVNLAK
ncbi:MAG: VWA domain-containing protein [Armatimonadota bacterium]